MALIINLLQVWPGTPAEQPVRDLGAAKSAIFVGVVNGMASPSYLHLCLPGGAEDLEQRYYLYLLANFVTAMLGVALLVVYMAFSASFGSPVWPPVLRWTVWLTKVLTGGTLQFGLSILHFCVKMMCARLMLILAGLFQLFI